MSTQANESKPIQRYKSNPFSLGNSSFSVEVGEKSSRTVINPKQLLGLQQGHKITLRQLEIQSASPNSVHVIHAMALFKSLNASA